MFGKVTGICLISELKKLYKAKIQPVEDAYLFEQFQGPPMTDAEFDARPQVLMIGQYSTGKTSFIKYLLGRDFPGLRVGPEPTTDRFVAVIYGEEDRVIPGNALVVSPEVPYRGLDRFGSSQIARQIAVSGCKPEVAVFQNAS